MKSSFVAALIAAALISGAAVSQTAPSWGPDASPTNNNWLAFWATKADVAAPSVRVFGLTDAKSDAGIALTASATGGAPGVARTAGTSLDLVGEATSASAKTDKAMWELNVPSTYVAGAAIPVVVNANYTGTGTVTAAATTLTLNAYTEAAGVETAIAGITSAQQFTGTAAGYTFVIPSGSGLTPGSHIVVEIVMLVTTSANALTGQINSVSATM